MGVPEKKPTLTKQVRLDIEGFLDRAEQASSESQRQELRYKAFVLMGLRESVSNYAKEREITQKQLAGQKKADEAKKEGKVKVYTGGRYEYQGQEELRDPAPV